MVTTNNWIKIRSAAWQQGGDSNCVLEFVKALTSKLGDLDASERVDEVERLRLHQLRRCEESSLPGRLARIAAVNVIADLARQEARFREEGGKLQVSPGVLGRDSRRLRLLAQRTEQLRKPAVQSFIRGMERSRLFRGQWISVFSLMRDGRELAEALERVKRKAAPTSDAIQPYLQFVRPDERCEHTGLLLTNIWRYFRHTWTSPYQSTPGRSMTFLVRDGASCLHPIMGIAALSSSAVKLKVRDLYLGWEGERVVKELISKPSKRASAWLESTLERRLSEIYKSDLIADGLLSPDALRAPTGKVIEELRDEASTRRKQHHGSTEALDYKSTSKNSREDSYWEEQARTPLFRSKRAGELASLMRSRRILNDHFRPSSSKKGLEDLLRRRAGRRVVRDLSRLAKAVRVGTAIADLTVCGAVAPYNCLLVGKLVAMLAASPEVVDAYRRRYARTPSVIASSMAGRAIHRPADLVFIGTTSLYGKRPSQYDRVSIPGEVLGGRVGHPVRYRFIKRTEGWGSFQFGDTSTRAVMDFLKAETNGQRVNYVFGEGANPKMRALREGLRQLGFDEKAHLRHGQEKCVYGVPLISNLQDYLLGRSGKPRYLFSRRKPQEASRAIVAWWAERWLIKRLEKPRILEEVRQHTLVYPIEHGARVNLPRSDVEQGLLFEEPR